MTEETGPTLNDRLDRALDRAQNALGGHRVDNLIVVGAESYDTTLVRNYLKQIPASNDFTRLPSLLGGDQTLPITSMCVELAVSRMTNHPEPERLEPTYTLAQALHDRSQSRRARRMPIEQALSNCTEKNIVILGDPGSGKTSLLKRIALDVAQGSWQNWFIPLYASLRVYWQNRSRYREFGLSLPHYLAGLIFASREGSNYSAHRSLFMGAGYDKEKSDIDRLERLFSYLSGPERTDVVLLLDGFDEISSDPEARDTLTAEIAQLGHAFSWILTSRRAGFFGGLDEDIRYEVVDLDEDGIETLTRNWFAHQEIEAPGSFAGIVLDQVFANERLLAMARNPFLLTLLCHLQAASRQALPLHRAGVYERLIDCVTQQIRHRVKDDSILAPPVRSFLARFCHHLYTDRSRTPRHLFDRDDWLAFEEGQPHPDLDRQLLPSRLLDKWGQSSGYHLVHLTFHEYFVAQALLGRPLEQALQKIYDPHWRVVLRFYGSLLWHSGRSADFRTLVRACLDPIDRLGVMYVEAASLLSEAGVEDSHAVLGYDLRDRLWRLWEENRPYIAEAAADALAILSPDDTVERCRLTIETAAPSPSVNALATLAQIARGGHYEELGMASQSARAIAFLGKVRTAAAKSLLFDVLENGPEGVRRHVPPALARINDRETRSRVAAMLENADRSSSLFVYLCMVAEEARHGDFLPVLIRVLGDASPLAAEPVLQALARIGGSAIAVPVIGWLGRRQGEDFDRVAAHTALTASGAGEAMAYFREMALSGDQEHANAGAWGLLECGAAPVERIRELLHGDDLDWKLSVVELIGDRAEEGGRTPEPVAAMIRDLVDDPLIRRTAVDALAKIEIVRYAQQKSAPDRPLFRQLLDNDGGGDPEDDLRPVAAHVLGRIGDAASTDRLLVLAVAPSSGLSVRVACIGALGLIGRQLSGKTRRDIVRRLLPLVGDPEGAVAAAAADAVAAVDFTVLKPHGSDSAVRDALARQSAEQGLLLFPEFYVDAHGVIVLWKNRQDAGAGLWFILMNLEEGAVLSRLTDQLLGAGRQPAFDRLEGTVAGILCVGAHGLLPDQAELAARMLARHADEPDWPLIAVLLPGATVALLPGGFLGLPVVNYSPIDHAEETVARIVALLCRS